MVSPVYLRNNSSELQTRYLRQQEKNFSNLNYRDTVSLSVNSSNLCRKQSVWQDLWHSVKSAWNSLSWYEKPLILFLPLSILGCASTKKSLPPQLEDAVFGGLVELGNLAEKKYTICLHLNGDNSLGVYDYDWNNINQIIAATKTAGVSDNANILVLWDDPYTRHAYFYIANGEVKYVYEAGEVNMGRTETAKDFIDYAVSHCPAEKYVFIFWNHGNGAAGVSYDDTNSDYLTGVEQKNILNYFSGKIGRKVDIVGYDACLMGTFDVFYQLKDYVDYGIGSQQLEPGTGWQYSFLNSLQDATLTPRSLAKEIVNAYDAQYSAVYDDYTLAAVDLQYADSIATAIDNFSSLAIASGVPTTIYRNFMYNTTNFYSTGTPRALDLKMFMDNIAASAAISSTVKAAAQTVSGLIYTDNGVDDDYVIISRAGINTTANGTSITLSDATYYRLLDIAINTQWNEFCRQYFNY